MLFGNGDYIFAEQIVADEQQQAMKLTYMKKTEFAQGQWQDTRVKMPAKRRGV